MPEDRISPEEKLLNLIRNNTAVGEKKKETGLLKNKKEKKAGKIFSVRPSLRPILISIIILLSGWILYKEGFRVRENSRINFLGREESGLARPSTSGQRPGREAVTLPPFSYYSQEIGGKSLFSPLVIEKTSTSIARGEKIEELVKNYHLKGVIVGEKPEAFIEDIQAHRTFTVTIGDTVGKLEVKDIKEGKVTFSYEEETYDLSF